MSWREQQKQNFNRLEELLDFLEIEPKLRKLIAARSEFPLNVPRRLAAKMAKNSLDDPLLRQFLPLLEEKKSLGFVEDPVGENKVRKAEKLLHKYEGRALLVTTSACVMNCRFCFRQHFPYSLNSGFEEELALIAQDSSLEEIILSGGDPLSLSNAVLGNLIKRLGEIDHVKLLRFHTRFPIGIPERIDEGFLSILRETRLQVVFVIHGNHPDEFDEEVISSLKKILILGVPLLHQAVLLKNVNDSVETLKLLFKKLVCNGILPYYLHQLDRVQGAAHFEVSEKEGVALMEKLQSLLPGYALPRYVKETAGAPSKIPIILI